MFQKPETKNFYTKRSTSSNRSEEKFFVQARKSLGQNFLRSPGILKKIVDAGDIRAGEIVLEIGPGEGTLTRELLSRNAQVIAVEKDDRLIPILSEKFSKEIASGQLQLVHADILKVNLDSLKLTANSYKLIANIPYYITGAIFKKFLESEHQPTTIVVLTQKEVADRIVAREGKQSILSISIKAYGTPTLTQKVPRGAFVPAPNVDSAILAITNISKTFFAELDEKKFFEILKQGFGSKRKKLLNNLPGEKPALEKLFSELNIPHDIRAEDLSVEHWKTLAMRLGETNFQNQ